MGPLMAEFKSEHFSFRKECLVRAAAAEALVKIGQPAVAPLIAALGTVDDSANAAAVDALVKIGRPAVEPLVAALKHSRSDVREAAAAALGQIGDTRAVEPLVAALKHTDFRMNIYWSEKAIEALGKIGDARAVAPLVAALGTVDDSANAAAAEALVKIGQPTVEPLIAALKSGCAEPAQSGGRDIGPARRSNESRNARLVRGGVEAMGSGREPGCRCHRAAGGGAQER